MFLTTTAIANPNGSELQTTVGGIINPKWRCMTAVQDDHAHDPQNLVAKLVLSIVPPVEWVIHNDWALSDI